MKIHGRRDLRSVGLAAAMACGVAAAAFGAPCHADQAGTAPAFDRFKALVGEWVAAADGPMAEKGDLVARYALTAGGTAVVETEFPGTPHEMVTVYTVEGQDVVLTHYCTSGNQPRMRAAKAAGARLEFAFDGGGNVDPKSSKHMHSAVFEFLGPDEIRSEWTELADGKPAMVVPIHLVRKR